MRRIVTGVERIAPWVSARLLARLNADEAIGLERNGELIAGVVYESWNGASFVCHIAIRGLMTPEYLAAIFDYPFVHCGAKKIFAPVVEGNDRSIRFVENLGFRLEHRLLDAHPDGSILLFGMKRDQCRFIGERYGKSIRREGRLIVAAIA